MDKFSKITKEDWIEFSLTLFVLAVCIGLVLQATTDFMSALIEYVQ